LCEAHAVGVSADYNGKCVDDDCIELGEAAAEHIVLDHFCAPDTAPYSSPTTYNQQCKNAAYSVCEGDIAQVANRWCPDKTLNAIKLHSMQGKCEEQVENMLK
jgi:hypothetical protein